MINPSCRSCPLLAGAFGPLASFAPSISPDPPSNALPCPAAHLEPHKNGPKPRHGLGREGQAQLAEARGIPWDAVLLLPGSLRLRVGAGAGVGSGVGRLCVVPQVCL